MTLEEKAGDPISLSESWNLQIPGRYTCEEVQWNDLEKIFRCKLDSYRKYLRCFRMTRYQRSVLFTCYIEDTVTEKVSVLICQFVDQKLPGFIELNAVMTSEVDDAHLHGLDLDWVRRTFADNIPLQIACIFSMTMNFLLIPTIGEPITWIPREKLLKQQAETQLLNFSTLVYFVNKLIESKDDEKKQMLSLFLLQ